MCTRLAKRLGKLSIHSKRVKSHRAGMRPELRVRPRSPLSANEHRGLRRARRRAFIVRRGIRGMRSSGAKEAAEKGMLLGRTMEKHTSGPKNLSVNYELGAPVSGPAVLAAPTPQLSRTRARRPA